MYKSHPCHVSHSCLCLLTAGGAIVAVDVAMLLYKGSAKEKNHENLRVCNISATFWRHFFHLYLRRRALCVQKMHLSLCLNCRVVTLSQVSMRDWFSGVVRRFRYILRYILFIQTAWVLSSCTQSIKTENCSFLKVRMKGF